MGGKQEEITINNKGYDFRFSFTFASDLKKKKKGNNFQSHLIKEKILE